MVRVRAGKGSDPARKIEVNPENSRPYLVEEWRESEASLTFLDLGSVVQEGYGREFATAVENHLSARDLRGPIEFALTGKAREDDAVRNGLQAALTRAHFIRIMSKFPELVKIATLKGWNLASHVPLDGEVLHHLALFKRGRGDAHPRINDALMHVQISYAQRQFAFLPEILNQNLAHQFSESNPLPFLGRLPRTEINRTALKLLADRVGGEPFAELTRLGRLSDDPSLSESVKAAFYLRVLETAMQGPHPIRYLVAAMNLEMAEVLGARLGFVPLARIETLVSRYEPHGLVNILVGGKPPGSRRKRVVEEVLGIIDLRESATHRELLKDKAAGVVRPEAGELYSALLSNPQ